MELSLTEAKNLLREWRDTNERRSEDVVEIWYNVLDENFNKLGNESK